MARARTVLEAPEITRVMTRIAHEVLERNKGADRQIDALERVDAGGEPVGERYAPGRDAQENRAGRAGCLLQNLVRDAVDDALQIRRGENDFRRSSGRR